LLTKHSLFEL
jgi:enhancer of polycomb-like protein